jgi:hypothetical protein
VYLRSLSTDAAGQLNILRHDSNTLGVDGTQVGIFKESYKVGLGGFLKGQDGRSLESKITLEVLGNLTDKTLEGQLADEKVRRLLVSTNLTKGNSSRSVSVGLLDTSGGGGRLTSGLGGELLSGSLSSGGLTGGLLRSVEKQSRGRVSGYVLVSIHDLIDPFYRSIYSPWFGPWLRVVMKEIEEVLSMKTSSVLLLEILCAL